MSIRITPMPRNIVIQNHSVRTDIAGKPIDCHDGCLRFFDGMFYHYGTRYGTTDGFTPANQYVCYRSHDLQQWEPMGPILAEPLPGVSYRPYVVFNKRTKKYVLWFNWYRTLWHGQFASAVSDSPSGPFKLVDDNVTLRFQQPGDHNLFVDDDGTAYLVYTSIVGDGVDRHAMSVEKLDADYTRSSGVGSQVLDRKVEAPAMFKRDGKYYVLFGQTCCFCPEGSDARVFVADKPLGPYTKIGDINRDADGKIIVPGQQSDIATLPTPDGPALIWIADLWSSRADGVKGHDIQFWSAPLKFNADGTIRPLERTPSFELTLSV
jgi:hypothetical protein